MSQASGIFDRIYELQITLNAAGDTLAVDKLVFYRNRQSLDAGNGFEPGITGGAASGSPHEIELSRTLPPPSVIRHTFSAF